MVRGGTNVSAAYLTGWEPFEKHYSLMKGILRRVIPTSLKRHPVRVFLTQDDTQPRYPSAVTTEEIDEPERLIFDRLASAEVRLRESGETLKRR